MDDLDPRYCIRCRRRIPRTVSEEQDVCDDCRAALEELATGSLGPAPPRDRPPPCPRCGSEDVERRWTTDWLSWLVDVFTGSLAVLAELLAWTPWRPETGRDADGFTTVRTLRYRCRNCRMVWKPN